MTNEIVYATWPAKGRHGMNFELRLALVRSGNSVGVDLREWRNESADRPGPTRKGWRFTPNEVKELHAQLGRIIADIAKVESEQRLLGNIEPPQEGESDDSA